MSKMIKCDACEKPIDLSKTQMLEHVEVNGVSFTIKLEVSNKYVVPKPPSHDLASALIPMMMDKNSDLDLCPECFVMIITALKDQFTR